MHMYIACVFVCLALSTSLSRAEVTYTESDIPPDLQECLHIHAKNETNPSESRKVLIYGNCLREFLWKADMIQWDAFNITQKNIEFINSLTHSLVHPPRVRRSSSEAINRPKSGSRVRQEYRRLSNKARRELHAAINLMKKYGQYDIFANIHRGIVVTSAHGGANFMGWHRVYIALFEEALRKINHRVVLPYWDATFDYNMPNPENTIIFSDIFAGNGDGYVVTGAFAYWKTPYGPLARNIGKGSRLISSGDISRVLSRCRTTEITYPTAKNKYNFERYHGGAHIWVNGQMRGLSTATHDPTFFIYHAFIDYIWELFRQRQARKQCRVNPRSDYPKLKGQHNALRGMDGLNGYRNIDGYAHYWTRLWYRYEPTPSCSKLRPSCGSKYLYCNRKRYVCVSIARRRTKSEARAIEAVGYGAFYVSNVRRARAEAARASVGPLFQAPGPGPRTQDGSKQRKW